MLGWEVDMFDGFDLLTAPGADGVEFRARVGGTGPAVVLLHGHPRTHTTWHRVAPRLVEAGFRVVCPDLRGYGRSAKPPPDREHRVHCDRAMAADVVALADHLGIDRFSLAGHDRGSYVAYRTALDHPDRVSRLAVLDGVPIVEALERADARFAEAWWHWFFFGGSPDQAVRVITADPLGWYSLDAATMGEENHEDTVAALTDPRTVQAMVEDYAASLHVDRAADEADRAAGRQIECPTLVAWSRHDDLGDLYGDPAAVWTPWCRQPVASAVIDSGHHMAEQAPEQLAAVLARFFTA
jgi:haloacetate dehalogenase